MASASEGCGKPAPESLLQQMRVAGISRNLITVVPDNYSSSVRHRLVIAFHGRTNPAAQVRRYYDLERHANTPTIFVYPSGTADSRGRFSWWLPGESPNALRDYALFDALVARLYQDYCIGETYLVGHSLGASIVNNLGCARGEFIRAIVSVAGGMERPDCNGSTAVMLVHNPNDRLVSVRYGQAARDHFLDYGLYTGTPQPEEFMGLACSRYREFSRAYPLLWCLSDYDTTRRGRYYPHQWPPDMGMRAMAFFDALAPAPGRFLPPTHIR